MCSVSSETIQQMKEPQLSVRGRAARRVGGVCTARQKQVNEFRTSCVLELESSAGAEAQRRAQELERLTIQTWELCFMQ